MGTSLIKEEHLTWRMLIVPAHSCDHLICTLYTHILKTHIWSELRSSTARLKLFGYTISVSVTFNDKSLQSLGTARSSLFRFLSLYQQYFITVHVFIQTRKYT